MLIHAEAFGLAFLGCAATNLDNTLLAQTILFSDLASPYHVAALAGSVGAAAVLTAAAVVIFSRRGRAKKMLNLASRARPWILIVVGLLIFMDTGFDTQ